MKKKTPSFHIRHNATPEVLRVILTHCLDEKFTREQLACKLNKNIGTINQITPLFSQLGLLGPDSFTLTSMGIAFRRLNEQLSAFVPEAIHHLLYTAHIFDKGKCFSWAYADVVDTLWTSESQVLDGKEKAQLVGRVVEEATQAFGIPVEQIAFSVNSINGVLNWLRALDPPVVINTGKRDSFCRRYFCPPVIFLWAVDFLYRAEKKFYGVRIFLTPERIDRLCKLCILDPSGLDNVLMMAKRTSDYDHGGLFDYGTEGGFGRWILLARPCPVPTLPEDVER